MEGNGYWYKLHTFIMKHILTDNNLDYIWKERGLNNFKLMLT